MGFRNAGGGLGGTAILPGPASGSIDLGDDSEQGISPRIALADHEHPFPAPNAAPNDLAAAAVIGASTRPAAQNHVHRHRAVDHAGGAFADLTGILSAIGHVHGALAGYDTQGLRAARPAAGNVGATYYATDVDRWYRDNGAVWKAIAAPARIVVADDYIETPDGFVNNTAPFAQMVTDAAAGDRRGIILLRPGGLYSVDQVDLTGKPVSIWGHGERGTFIIGRGTAHVIYANNGAFVTGISLVDVNIQAAAAPQAVYDCINFTKVELYSLTRVGMGNGRYGFHGVVDCRLGTHTDCVYGSNNQQGIHLGAGCDQNDIGGWVDENLATGVYCNGSNNLFRLRCQDNVGNHIFFDVAAVGNRVIANARAGTATGSLARIYGDDNVIDATMEGAYSSLDFRIEAGADRNEVRIHKVGGGAPNFVDAGADSLVSYNGAPAGTRLIDYAESLEDFTTATIADIPGMVITVPAGTTPVEISFGGFMYNSAAARAPQLRLTDLANTVIDSAGETIAVANDLTEGFRTRVLPPSAADRTFKLRLMADASSGAGTGHSFGYDNGVGGCWPVTLKATLA